MPSETEAWGQVRGDTNPLNRRMFHPPQSPTTPYEPLFEGLGEVMVQKIQNSEPGELSAVVEQAAEMTGQKPGVILDTIVHGVTPTPTEYEDAQATSQPELNEVNRQLKAGEISAEEHKAKVDKINELTKLIKEDEISSDDYFENLSHIEKSRKESVKPSVKSSDDKKKSIEPEKPKKESTVFDKYGIEPYEYDEWDWLRDVGFHMMSNEGTGILDSFGLAATAANKNLRETSKSNRELKNKLKLKEAEAKAAAIKEANKKLGKTFTIYDEKSGRDIVYRDVPMGTDKAIPHPYELGRWVVKEPKKPTATGSKGKGGTKASKDYKMSLITEAAQGIGVFSDKYSKEDVEKIEAIDAQIEAARKAGDSDMMIALLAQKAEIHTRERGAWAQMSDPEQGNILRFAEEFRDERMRKDGVTKSDIPQYEYDRRLVEAGGRILNNLGYGTEFEKRKEFKNDPRFSKTTLDYTLGVLGDEVGLDIRDDLFNTDWLDVGETGVTEKGMSEIRRLQKHPTRFNEFLADLTAKIQITLDEGGEENDVIQLIDYAVNNLNVGEETEVPRYSSEDIEGYMPEPAKYKGQFPGAVWQQTSQGWGYVFPDTQKWIPATKLK